MLGRAPMHICGCGGGAREGGGGRALAGVEVRALRFALEAIAPGTVLQGASIAIDEPEGQAWCLPCAATVPLARRGDPCPQCSSHQLQPTGGTELRVVDLLVDDE